VGTRSGNQSSHPCVPLKPWMVGVQSLTHPREKEMTRTRFNSTLKPGKGFKRKSYTWKRNGNTSARKPLGFSGRKRLTSRPDRKLSEWSRKVRERDDYTCQRCGIRDEYRNMAHHRAPRSTRPDLRLVVENGVTLCPECHSAVHANPITSRAAGWLADETYEAAQKARAA